MEILIVGEFSGFANNLKKGFIQLGHNVCIFTTGDGSKKIPYDKNDIFINQSKNIKIFNLNIKGSWIIRSTIENIKLRYKLTKDKKKYDLIIIINSTFIKDRFFSNISIDKDILFNLMSKNSKLILSCCGDDPAYYKYGKDLRYWPYNYDSINPRINSRYNKSLFIDLLKKSNIIVPTSFDYYKPIDTYCKEHKIGKKIVPILLPVDISKNQINQNTKKTEKKIVFLHGLNRPNFKGTKFIKEAFDLISCNYKDSAECIISENMPYEEYLKLIDKADVILDQTNGYGLGMNAMFGLALGKVVLGGGEPENNELFNVDIPVINIIPDALYIYKQMENLILNPHIISEYSVKSRIFIERNCESSKIAQKYIDLCLK